MPSHRGWGPFKRRHDGERDDIPTAARPPHDISDERTTLLPPGAQPGGPAKSRGPHNPQTTPVGDPTPERLSRASAPSAPPPAASSPAEATAPGAPPAAIPAPTRDPEGALTTYIGEPAQAAQIVRAVRAAQARARQDVTSIAASLAEIAASMHRHVRTLEHAVEGQFSNNLADPRTRLLSDSLSVVRQADLRLAQLDVALRRLGSTVQSAQSNVDALQHERERLSSLYQIAQELNTSLNLEDVLGRVMDKLIEVVHAERGFLMLWDEPASALQFVAARGADGASLGEADFGISRNIVEGVWQRQEPILTTDAQRDERLQRFESIAIHGIRSVMCAPLRVRGHGVGIVYVDSRHETRLFDPAHLDLLAAFCNQAAIAIDNARLFADLRRHIREISEIKNYMDNIFASIASGVVTADTDGMVTTFNRAAERIFALDGGSTIGQPYERVLALLGDASLGAILARALAASDETLGYETRPTLPARGEVTLRLNISPLRSGERDGEGKDAPLGVAMVVDDLTELRRSQQQAEDIQRLFGRYVHPAVVRQLLADPSAVNLGGETRQITVVFADIRGYTQLAEAAAPDELVRILNSYLDILTAAIWREEGTVTMFIGDALMSIFNAPLPQPDHALRAVRAAWAMRLALEENAQASMRASRPERPPVAYGIGVHTGLATVGNIGAHGRLQNYTAIGDAVNTAQRLESGAAANQILLSAATYAAVAPHVEAHPREPLLVKGKTLPLQVYELDGLGDPPREPPGAPPPAPS